MGPRRARRAEVGSWWNPSTSGDVTAEQQRVDAQRAALATSIASRAPTSGTPAQIDNAVKGWNALNAQVIAYVAEQPSILWWTRDEQVKQGQTYEAQIEAYRQTFANLGASVPSAPAAPAAQPGLLNTNLFGGLASGLEWVVIGFLAFKLLGEKR